MVGKTGTVYGRKHAIGKNKITGVGEVIRDVFFPHLGIGKHSAIHVAIVQQIEAVHLAAVDSPDSLFTAMAKIEWKSVRRRREWNESPVRGSARDGAVGARKAAEVGVEGAVLFDDEDDVLNLREPLSFNSRSMQDRMQAIGFTATDPEEQCHKHNSRQDCCGGTTAMHFANSSLSKHSLADP